MENYYLTLEVRLVVKDAKDEYDARTWAIALMETASDDPTDVEIKGVDVRACTQED